MSKAEVAVVTGAGSGIGAAIGRELSQRGYAVVFTDIDAERAARSAAGIPHASSLRLDVTSPQQCAEVVAEVTGTHHRLDVWVSNAGISKMQPFLEISPEDFERSLRVNTTGVFLASQAAARYMAANGGGRIVNIASMAAKQGKVPFLADYVASKFAVLGLTQAMAFELAEVGIRVNSVCPGYVATEMQQRELAWEAGLRGTTPEEVREAWIGDTPLGRLEQPEDVARVVAFLCGPDAAFLTGESIAVNGGAFMD
jgi:NAD(P)-dependent dehydrogenase (short-subunit alcohol dehydrogenase family)